MGRAASLSLYFTGVPELIRLLKTLIFVEPTPLKMIVCVINKVTSKALFCFVQCVSHFVLLIQKVMKCACVFRGDGRKGSNRYESRVIPVDGQFSE